MLKLLPMKTLSSKTVYKNRWMTVREDEVERDNGQKGIYGVVEKPDFVIIIPFDGTHLYMVEQYRYPVAARFWEFPQGSWEHAPNIDPKELARAELAEETGLVAANLTYLGHLYEAYGYSNQGMHAFLATDLQEGEQQLDDEEHGLIVRKFTVDEVKEMIRQGSIKDNSTLAAWSLWSITNS